MKKIATFLQTVYVPYTYPTLYLTLRRSDSQQTSPTQCRNAAMLSVTSCSFFQYEFNQKVTTRIGSICRNFQFANRIIANTMSESIGIYWERIFWGNSEWTAYGFFGVAIDRLSFNHVAICTPQTRKRKVRLVIEKLTILQVPLVCHGFG